MATPALPTSVSLDNPDALPKERRRSPYYTGAGSICVSPIHRCAQPAEDRHGVVSHEKIEI